MATAREERPYDAGLGTGGKFRKRPTRRSHAATPYDRPPTALRNPSAAASNGWLSKLVDPAHRLITAGAHRLFSSVFRKRLPPPPLRPPHSEASQEPRDEHQEAVSSDHPDALEVPINGENIPTNGSNKGGLMELEQILKQKTFTRSEVDRLTTLLRSRSDEMPVEDEEKRPEEKRFETISSKPVEFQDRKEGYPNTPLRENRIENHLALTPFVSTTVLDEDVASPAQLAKAYMGSRPSKLSPSMLGRSQAFREDSFVISNPPFPPKSPITSLVQRASGHVAVPANGFMTPRSRGRSAIYNMARTPYSRVHRTSTLKGPTIDASGGPSSSMSSQYEWELTRPSGSQQGALKRRSSVLDSDIGSVGPMRRTRQKHNLISRKGLSLPVSAQQPTSAITVPSENGDNNMAGPSFTPVPSKSKEMASKILQHLEKLTPKEKSPTKLSPSMLRGKALRSLENPDSSKVFENVRDSNKLDGLVNSSLPDAQKSTEKKDQDETNGPTKFLSLGGNVAPAENGSDTAVSIKDTVPSFNTDNSSLKITGAYPPQKKRAFQMSAHEDFLDLEDDVIPNGVASTPSVEVREKLDNSVFESKTTAPEAVKVDKPPSLSEVKPSTGFALNEKTNLTASNGSVVAEKSSGFSFSTASSSMTALPAMGSTQTSFASHRDTLPKESSSPHPIFSFGDKVALPKESSPAITSFGLGSKSADNAPQAVFASSSSLADSSDLNLGSSSYPKPERISSFATVDAGATDSVSKVPESDEARTENNLKSEVRSKTPETAQLSAVSTSSSTAGIFTFGSSNNPSLKSGSPSSFTSFSSSVPPLFSGNTISQSSSSSASLSATTTTATTTSSSLPVFPPVSSFQAAPTFKFGSAAPSNSTLPASGASGVETVEPKAKLDTSFGNSSSSLFDGVSKAASASTGSSIFSFGASAVSANSQSQGSTPFGGSSGSLISSPAVSGVATVTQSMPIQFGTSGSSPSFGLSSGSSLSSGNSFFGSSAPATLFSSGTGFGASSSAASSDGNTVSSSSSTVSGMFGSSWQPTKSPIFGASFNSTSSSTGFSFGASAASTAATSSSTGFSFGASAASTAATNTVSTPFGSSSTSVTATNNATMSFGSSLTSGAAANSAPMPFGSSSSGTVTNSAPMPFGSTAAGSSGSLFSFTAAASNGASSGPGFSFTSVPPTTTSQPVFGNPSPPAFAFGSASAGNDQMSMEDSMAEDTVQASTPTPTVPTFSQQPFSPTPSSFMFNSSAPTGANPFQFGGQQNPATAQQTLSPFQASGSLDFNASGNFSLGTGGGDKSNRKIVKVKGKHRRK